MAKRRKPGRPKVAIKKVPLFTLKDVPKYGKWVTDLAKHRGKKVSQTVRDALAEHAEKYEFDPPPGA